MLNDRLLGEKILTLLLIPGLALALYAGVRRLVIALRTGRYDSRSGFSAIVRPPGETDRKAAPRVYWLSILVLCGAIILGVGFSVAFIFEAFRHFGWWPT